MSSSDGTVSSDAGNDGTGIAEEAGIAIGPAPADFDDWETLHALLRDAFAYMDGRIDPPSSMNRLDAAALAGKAREERLLLARDGGRLVGCAFLRPDLPTMYLGKLAVRASGRGRGVGVALVRHALALAAGLGARAVELQVRVELVENRAFFESLGFAKVGESAHAGYTRARPASRCDATSGSRRDRPSTRSVRAGRRPEVCRRETSAGSCDDDAGRHRWRKGRARRALRARRDGPPAGSRAAASRGRTATTA